MSTVFKFSDMPSFKDGDDDGTVGGETFVNIRIVDNGYIVQFESDEEDCTSVYLDKNSLLEYLSSIL